MKITIETDMPIFNRRPPMPGEKMKLYGHDFRVVECGWQENSTDGAIYGLRLTLCPFGCDAFGDLCFALPEVSK